MEIKFIPNEKHYGKAATAMSNVTLNIETVNQLIECIRDGYIPCISWTDTKLILFKITFKMIDDSMKYTCVQCTNIIEEIEKYYLSKSDFYTSDAIMVFKRFLETGVLSFEISDWTKTSICFKY